MSKRLPLLAILLLGLPACSQMDMQGNDPKDFYSKNPIKNQVATKQAEATVKWRANEGGLSYEQKQSLQHQLNEVSPAALESITIETASPVGQRNRTELLRSLRDLGFRAPVFFERGVDLRLNELRVITDYAAIVSPNCPDWRTSPVTTYSNTKQGNIGCATVTNLGLMLEDPRDLVRGSSGGIVEPHTERSVDAVTHYRHGMTPPAPPPSAATPSSGGGNDPMQGMMPLPTGP